MLKEICGLLIAAALWQLVPAADNDSQEFVRKPNAGGRYLTPEEVEMAAAARREIANTLEKNLIKFFTLVAAADDNGNESVLFPRQDYDDEEAGLNPNTLPQVAQILGAIFAGNLNLTSIVDKTAGLLPTVLRTQAEGVFKYLSGGVASYFGGTTTIATTRKPKPVRAKSTTVKAKATSEAPAPEDVTTLAINATEETTKKDVKRKSSYKIIRKKDSAKEPETPESAVLDEDKFTRLQEAVVSAAIEAEPLVRNKEPRFFVRPFQEILTNFDNGRLNLTQIIKFLPDLFQGARQAFVLLENLGEIAGVDLDDD